MRTRGLFEVEREHWDVIPWSSALPLFTLVRGRCVLRSSGFF
jgi:hypothetical protein